MKQIFLYSILLFGLLLSSSCSKDEADVDLTIGKWSVPIAGSKGSETTITWEEDNYYCPISFFEIKQGGTFTQVFVSRDSDDNCVTTIPEGSEFPGTFIKTKNEITFKTTVPGNSLQTIRFKIESLTADKMILQQYNEEGVLQDMYYLFNKKK